MENFFNTFKEGDYERLPKIVAKDGSSPAVSCLKVEPKVSTFPVIKAAVAVFITIATIKILVFGHI